MCIHVMYVHNKLILLNNIKILSELIYSTILKILKQNYLIIVLTIRVFIKYNKKYISQHRISATM